MVDIWVEVAILSGLLGLSAFFSGLEVALVGVRQSTVVQLLKEKKKGSKALHKLKTNPGWMMSSVNLGNNIVNVGASAFATSVAIRLFGDEGLGVAVGVMTFLILIFGEITPKTYCNANSTKVSLRFAPVLLAFSYALYPIVKFFEIVTKAVVKMSGSSYAPPPITEDDIHGVIAQGHEDKAIEKDEMEMVAGALKFDDTLARSIMIPRTKIFALSSRMLLFETLGQINKSGHSRIPIFEKNIDDIVGYIHVRDVLKALENDTKMIRLEEIARKPVFVSHEGTVNSVLMDMKVQKVHMAIIIDEHGGTEGLLTLEDLFEEIVGDIEDESDAIRSDKYEKIDKNTIVTKGDIEIDTVNTIFDAKIPKGYDYSSLNGVLHEKLRDIPKEGDILEIGGVKIVVESVSKNIPQRIKISKILD